MRTWASRSALPVSIEAISIVAATDVSASVAPTTTSTSNRWKRPRTLDTPRWRIAKPTEEWFGVEGPAAGGEGEGRGCGGGHGGHRAGVTPRGAGRPGRSWPRRATLRRPVARHDGGRVRAADRCAAAGELGRSSGPAASARRPRDVGLPDSGRRRTPGPAPGGGRHARRRERRLPRAARAGPRHPPVGRGPRRPRRRHADERGRATPPVPPRRQERQRGAVPGPGRRCRAQVAPTVVRAARRPRPDAGVRARPGRRRAGLERRRGSAVAGGLGMLDVAPGQHPNLARFVFRHPGGARRVPGLAGGRRRAGRPAAPGR